MDQCPAHPASGFISSISGYIDCQSQLLGSGAWSALAAPGSMLTTVLTGFLTITIALVGYNLLLGRSVTLRDGSIAILKIGAVFALATSWPAYRTLIYDLVVDGPGQVVAEIGPQAGVVGSDGSLLPRLDFADGMLAQLATLGPGTPSADAVETTPLPPFRGFDAFALGGSRILFELTAVASLGIVRVVAGLMLALGPFFLAFIMFEGTRSLFEGWVRVLGGAALAAIGVSITLGLELGMLEPWLRSVLAQRIAGDALPTMATELFVIICLFSIIIAASLLASARVACAFRLGLFIRAVPIAESRRPDAGSGSESSFDGAQRRDRDESRAAVLADILVSASRRDQGSSTPATNSIAITTRISAAAPLDDTSRLPLPIGRSFTKRPNARLSAAVVKRDSGA